MCTEGGQGVLRAVVTRWNRERLRRLTSMPLSEQVRRKRSLGQQSVRNRKEKVQAFRGV